MKDLTMNAYDVTQISHAEREDTADEKRVELHLHTNMSTMDATNSISDFVSQAAKWGIRPLPLPIMLVTSLSWSICRW